VLNTCYALVIGFPKGGTQADMGDFFLTKSPLFGGEAKQPTRLEDAIHFSS